MKINNNQQIKHDKSCKINTTKDRVLIKVVYFQPCSSNRHNYSQHWCLHKYKYISRSYEQHLWILLILTVPRSWSGNGDSQATPHDQDIEPIAHINLCHKQQQQIHKIIRSIQHRFICIQSNWQEQRLPPPLSPLICEKVASIRSETLSSSISTSFSLCLISLPCLFKHQICINSGVFPFC